MLVHILKFVLMVQQAAYQVVESVLEPHWIGGDNPNVAIGSTEVTWLDGTPANNFLPWDSSSGQPNDCDGPDQPESCIFLGLPSAAK